MSSSRWIAVVVSTFTLINGSVFARARREAGPKQMLSIHLYDQAQVPIAMLQSATVEATRLFRAAGIRITWERPAIEAGEDRGIDMSDRRSGAFGPFDQRFYLVVRLVRGMPASAFPSALGFALPFARTGAQVTIFYDRVEASTRLGNAESYVILGYALAHEIGHVLLGSSTHAHAGLMQAWWNSASWKLASAGLLTFRPEETERLRAGVERLQAQHPQLEHEPVLAWSKSWHSPK